MTCSRVGSRYPIRGGMSGSSCCLDARRAGHRKWEPPFTQSESAQEGHQILLLRRGQLVGEDEVEELDRILEREEPTIVEIGRRVLNPAQREGLDRPVGARHCAVDQYRLVEALGVQIVNEVVGIVGPRLAGAALPVADN